MISRKLCTHYFAERTYARDESISAHVEDIYRVRNLRRLVSLPLTIHPEANPQANQLTVFCGKPGRMSYPALPAMPVSLPGCLRRTGDLADR